MIFEQFTNFATVVGVFGWDVNFVKCKQKVSPLNMKQKLSPSSEISVPYINPLFSYFYNKARSRQQTGRNVFSLTSSAQVTRLAIFAFRAYAGIVGFVDVPYLVLEPTHNKQDFADAKV